MVDAEMTGRELPSPHPQLPHKVLACAHHLIVKLVPPRHQRKLHSTTNLAYRGGQGSLEGQLVLAHAVQSLLTDQRPIGVLGSCLCANLETLPLDGQFTGLKHPAQACRRRGGGGGLNIHAHRCMNTQCTHANTGEHTDWRGTGPWHLNEQYHTSCNCIIRIHTQKQTYTYIHIYV